MDTKLKNSGNGPAMDPLHAYTDPEYRAEGMAETMAASNCLTAPFNLDEHETLFTFAWDLTSFELVASGGFGQVYKAQDPNENKAALKIMSSKYCTEKMRTIWYRRVQRELAIMKILDGHPNIVSLHDNCFFGRDAQTKVPSYVAFKMEYLPYDMARATATRPLSWEDLGPLVDQIGQALEWMHSKAIVHHDLKLANIMCHHRTFKIVDFNLARCYKTLEGTVLRTESAWRAGTKRYRSPEKENKTQAYDPFSADNYAFATAMVAALVGESAFSKLFDEHKCMLAVLEKILGKEKSPKRKTKTVKNLYSGLRSLLLPEAERATLQLALQMCKH